MSLSMDPPTETKSEVFCLTNKDGSILSPSVQATVLAKYSRSPLSAKEIVSNLTEEEADKFQDKWFVTYGHSSVAELASIPICFENVSIIASKFIESYQRGAYSEKSTRYQEFSSKSFVEVEGIDKSIRKPVERLYESYSFLKTRMFNICAAKADLDPKDPKNARLINARVFDNIRYLLPAGTGTNVGAVLNGRDIRYMIRDAVSHQNAEIRSIGEKLKLAVKEVFPVLLNKIEVDDFEPRIKRIRNFSIPTKIPVGSSVVSSRNYNSYCFESYKNSFNTPDYKIINEVYDKEKIELAKPRRHFDFENDVIRLYGMSWSQFCDHMEKRQNRSVPKVFRKHKISFDILMDYGAYRDMQRHRRCEQYSGLFTTDYGYVIPDDIIGTEFEDYYTSTMNSVMEFDNSLVSIDEDLSQYYIPLGFLFPVEFDMDLEQLYYISELRTKPQGHISYRRIAYMMYLIGNQLYPNQMKWCKAISPDKIGIHH